eukprot:TRINITY_DN27674_c0_g1_i1.p1 TRINITY_DN27674_c0_g1~~TRINITY_DN27674_c0_g1_i1.p1  ORF type:complete len:214 (+),score=86.47 TRINITY_DN27674_c0_g1_i1:49-690(+)
MKRGWATLHDVGPGGAHAEAADSFKRQRTDAFQWGTPVGGRYFTPQAEVYHQPPQPAASPPHLWGGVPATPPATPPKKRKLDAIDMLSEMVESVDISTRQGAAVKRQKRVSVHEDGEDVVLSVDKDLLSVLLPRFRKLLGYAMPPLVTMGPSYGGVPSLYAVIRMKKEALPQAIEEAYERWQVWQQHGGPIVEELDSDAEDAGDDVMEVEEVE